MSHSSSAVSTVANNDTKMDVAIWHMMVAVDQINRAIFQYQYEKTLQKTISYLNNTGTKTFWSKSIVIRIFEDTC